MEPTLSLVYFYTFYIDRYCDSDGIVDDGISSTVDM